MNHWVSTAPSLLPLSRLFTGEGKKGDRAPAQDKAFQLSLRSSITALISLFIFIVVTAGPSFGAEGGQNPVVGLRPE